MTRSKFHNKDAQILSINIQNFVTWATWWPGLVHLYLKRNLFTRDAMIKSEQQQQGVQLKVETLILHSDQWEPSLYYTLSSKSHVNVGLWTMQWMTSVAAQWPMMTSPLPYIIPLKNYLLTSCIRKNSFEECCEHEQITVTSIRIANTPCCSPGPNKVKVKVTL